MIRVGLVGFGLAGKAFHAPVISAVEGLELAAVVERHSRQAEQTYPAIVTYPSLEAMLGDDSLELIVIATPTPTHFPLASEALVAGRNVVVDKPVGTISSEVEGLIAQATEHGKLFIPFHNRRWDSDFRTFQKILLEEKLGRIVSFESSFDRWRPLPKHDVWRESGVPGSGILLDLGTHQVDQALVLFGLPLGVSADVACVRPDALSVDSYSVRLRYAHHIATIRGNNLTAIPQPHFIVRGTRGNFVKWGLDPQEDQLRKSAYITDPGWGLEPSSAWGTLAVDVGGGMVTHPVQPIAGDYRLFYAGVRDALLGKSKPPVLGIDALRAARILEWAVQSSAERREITCDWSEQPTEGESGL